jgi:hypothetical protein
MASFPFNKVLLANFLGLPCGKDALHFPYELMLDEVKSWVISLILIYLFILVFMNYLQLGHMEGRVGYQCCWKLQSTHIKVGFANDFIKSHILWNEPIC